MSRPDQEKFDEIERCYRDKVNHYYVDMGAAETADQAVDIDEQYRAAERAYNDALAKYLIGNSDQVAATLESLKKANEAVEKLRNEAATLARLLRAGAAAVGFATRLFLLAT